MQGDRMIGGEIAKILEKVAKTVAKTKKCQNIFNKAQFESPKHLHQDPSKPLKYTQQTIFSLKIHLGLIKIAQNDKIAANLVTLIE